MRVNPGVFRPSLALVLALPVLASPGRAHADSFGQISGGVSIPFAEDSWTDRVESSPKLAVRAGSVPGHIGGAISADWTPVNTDAEGFAIPGGDVDISAHRFRVLANLLFQVPIQNKLLFEGRGGVGVDIAHASIDATSGIGSSEQSKTDVGFGFEFGAGMWFNVGSVQLGAELAVPVAFHDNGSKSLTDLLPLDYTSYDFDLLFGVRFVSR